MTPVYNRGAGTTNFLMLKKAVSFILAVFLLLQSLAPITASASAEKSSPETYIFGSQTSIFSDDVKNSSGAFEYSYEFVIPTGINGLTPELNLKYNSQATGLNSPFGYGWNLSIPEISRMNLEGNDKLFDDDYFFSSLDGRLVHSTGSSYMPKVETGSFNQYDFSNNHWVVKTKDGLTYTFGYSTSTRQDNPGNSSETASWLLETVEDRNGNTIQYSYFKDEGMIYPETIEYASSSGSFLYEVLFERSSTSPLIQQSKSFAVTTHELIDTISLSVNQEPQIVYELEYSSSTLSNIQQLASITKGGYSESGGYDQLAPIQFTYSSTTQTSWNSSNDWDDGVPNGVYFFRRYHNQPGQQDTTAYYRTYLIDMNGDALADWVQDDDVYLNNGDGWATTSSFTMPVSSSNFDVAYRLADVNGDKLPDIIHSELETFHPSWTPNDDIVLQEVYLNNGDGTWTQSSEWEDAIPYYFYRHYNAQAGNPDSYYYNQSMLADINGDGLVDWLQNTSVYLNTGLGWEATSSMTLPRSIGNFNDVNDRYRLADINGDALPDIIQSEIKIYHPIWNEPDVVQQNVWLNEGDGDWNTDSGWEDAIPWYFYREIENAPGQSDQFYYNQSMLEDINGDGLVDWINSTDVYTNLGNGWENSNSLSLPISHGAFDEDYRLADVNGDNLPDVVQSRLDTYHPTYDPDDDVITRKVYLNSYTKPYHLSEIQNEYGGITTVSYKPSTHYFVGTEIANPDNPSLVYTVDAIENISGFGDISSTTFAYEGGDFYYSSTTLENRRFAGFEKVTRTSSLAKEISYFHQNNGDNSTSSESGDSEAKIGFNYRTDTEDLSGNIYKVTRTDYDDYSLGNDAVFVKRSGELRLDYDGDSGHKDLATAYTYDNTDGSVLSMTEYGEVSGSLDGTYSDIGSDKRTTEYDYATNTDGVVVVDTETLKNNSGTKVKESKYYYDSQSHGSVTDGNLTKREDWVTGSTYVDTEWTYNSYGLPTSETDQNNNTTYFSYDTYNLFPASTTNALGHTVWKDFDYSSGQVGTTTDQNGEVYVTTYDGLDRPLTEQIPDPQTGSLVTKSAYTYTDTAGVVKVQKTDYLNSATSTNSYTYLDGFGRPFQERVEAEDSNTYIVRDYIYGDNGLLAKESLPYFDTGSGSSTPTTDSELYSVYEYDALERTTAVGTVVGTTTTSYDQWQETVTDALSNDKDFTYDAFGRLTQVTEHNSTSTYDTDYEYDANDNLTKITDALNNERNVEYDGLSRRTLLEDLHDPSDTSFGEWTFTYDAASNLGTTTDPKNQTIAYTYDGLNRMLTENYTGQTGTEVTYTYDSCTEGVGYLCSVGNGVATTSYTYAKTGAIASEARQINGTTYTTEYDYDRQGNQILVTYPDDSEVAYTYNKGGQIESVQQREDGSSFTSVMDDFDYGPHSLVTYQLHGNGSETTKTYDADELYRLRSITTTATSSYGTGNGGEELLLLESELDLLASSTETVFEEIEVPEVEEPVSTTTTEVAAEQTEEPIATTTEEVIGTTTSTEEVIATSTLETATTTSSSTETVGTTTDSIATTTASSTEASTTTITFEFASSTEPVEESLSSTSTAVTTEAVILPEPKLPDAVPHKHEHTDKLITDTHEARVWQKYHRERIAELRKQEDLDPQILQNAIGAQDRFDDFLKKEGYTKNKGQDVSTSVRDVIFGIFGSMVENVTAWLLPEKLYAYLFAVEDFEDCSSLPCSLDTDSSWGSVTPSLDSTSKVEGADSLKEVVTGEGNGSIQTINYDEDEIYVQFKIYVPDPVTWGASSYFSILRFEDSSDGTVFWMSVEDWGAPRLIINGDVLSYTNTSLNLTEGAVNTIEVRFKKGTTDGEVDIWLNNDTEGSPDYSSGTTNTGTDNVDDILFGVTYAPESGVSTTYFDDLVIDSAFIGDTSAGSGPTPGVLFVETVQDLTYTYDAVGNITQIVDNSGTDSSATTTYGYDDLYRLTSASTTAASTTPYNRTYSYNAIGNILSKSDQGSYSYDGNQTSGSSYTLYDDAVASGWADQSWASSVDPDDTSPVNNGTKSIEVVYASAWQGLKYKNNDFDTTDYDDLEIAVNVGTDTSVNLYLYFRDSNDTLLDVVNLDSYNGGSWSANTWEELTIPLTALDMDNRTGTTSMHIEADGASTINYDDIKFTSVSGSASYANPHAATSIGGVAYTYDNNGNLASTNAGLTNTWDYLNRLTQSVDTSTTTYQYDHTGQRTLKENGTITTVYPNSLYEVKGATTTKHIYANDMLIATVEEDSPAPVLYHNHLDHLNSTNAVTGDDGYLNQLLAYYPFGDGRVDNQYDSINQGNRHTGHDYDSETNLTYRNARYQDTGVGRFTSMDPYIFENQLAIIDDPQLMNTYGYARNNPLMYDDPNGEIPDSIADWTNDRLRAAQRFGNPGWQMMGQSEYNSTVATMYVVNDGMQFGMDHPVAGGLIVAGLTYPALQGSGASIAAYKASRLLEGSLYTYLAYDQVSDTVPNVFNASGGLEQDGYNWNDAGTLVWETTMSFGPGAAKQPQFGIVGENVSITMEVLDLVHSVVDKILPESWRRN